MSDSVRKTWKFYCHLDTRDFFLITSCTDRERADVGAQIGDTCPLCGAPIVFAEQPPASRGSGVPA
jgi:hypothetical protein